jgi:hypothetical protein
MNDRSAMTEESPLFEQRLNDALDGLEYYYYDHLKNRMSKSNALTIADYILTMKAETNLTTSQEGSCYISQINIAVSR